MRLRRWQAEAICKIADWRPNPDPAVIRAVTGAGKSVVIARTAAWEVRNGGQVLITTPRQSLVRQLQATCDGAGAYYTHAKDIAPITVACNDSALAYLEAGGNPTLWIADEVHRTENDSLHAVAEKLPDIARLGFSATPWLSDRSRKLRLWDGVLYNYTPADALRDGVIVPIELAFPEVGDEDRLDALTQMCCADALERTRWVVCNAESIADAEHVAALVPRAWAVHSRMSKAAQEAVIAEHRAGGGVLVHCNLLTEGVDLPYLGALVLRKPTTNRVRFAQEIGRVIRTTEGKDKAWIYDIHDQFGAYSLDYDAALGWATSPPKTVDLAPKSDNPMGDVLDLIRVAPPSDITRYLRQMALDLAAHGYGKQVRPGSWRSLPPTDRQIEAVAKMHWVGKAAKGWGVNKPAVEVLRRAGELVSEMSRGQVSDMLDVVFWLAKHRSPLLEVGDEEEEAA